METQTEYATAVLAIVGVGVLAFLIYGPWQWFWADWYRQRLFETRDKIFDMAVEGRIGFEDPRYRAIRRALEAQIRFAHRATWPTALLVWMTAKALGESVPPSGLRSAVDAIENKALRHELQNLLADAGDALIFMVIARSPIIWVVACVVIPVMLALSACDHMQERLRRAAFEDIQTAAERDIQPGFAMA